MLGKIIDLTLSTVGIIQNNCRESLRKSKDYVYGIWVYKALGIWKGY